MNRILSTIAAGITCCGCALGDVLWPAEFSVPAGPEPIDSTISTLTTSFGDIMIKGKQNPLHPDSVRVDLTTFGTKNLLTLRKNTPRRFVSQSAGYDFLLDNNVGLQNHYIDFSGMAVQKSFPFRFTRVGLEWIPLLNINAERTRSNGRGMLHVGPVADIFLGDFPLRLRGGGVADIWHDSLPRHLEHYSMSHLQERKQDLGAYGGIGLSDFYRPIVPNVPLYGQGSAYIRELDSANVAATSLCGLYLNEVPTGDSLFLYVADSLLMGKSAMLSGRAGGPMQYSTTPHRVQHRMNAGVGLKGVPRFYCVPALSYSYNVYSVAYPSLIGDERRSNHQIKFLLATDSSCMVRYSGGIGFSFEKDDWVYQSSVPIQRSSGQNDNIDTLIENLKDNKGVQVEMVHGISTYTSSGLGGGYSFRISSDRKTYPNFYVSNGDTNRLYDDRDRINQGHMLTATIFSTPPCSIKCSGEYIKNLTSYVRSQKSANNLTERIYRFTVAMIVIPLEKLTFLETIGADAKVTAYQFPSFHTSSPPPYARKFFSRFGGVWFLRDAWQVNWLWEEVYLDNGYWEGAQYRDSSLGYITTDYYAIANKSLDSKIEISTDFMIKTNVRVKAGSLFRDIYYRVYKNRAYTVESFNEGYSMTPFVEVRGRMSQYSSVMARVKRYMDTIADDYWDIALMLSVGF